MSKAIRSGIIGLMSLACGGSLFATTLTVTGTVLDVNNGGGEYTANLTDPTVKGLDVYCIDFKDDAFFGTQYNVAVSTIGGPTFATDTNYGGDAASAFTYYTGVYTATNRYLMAGWLTSQYNVGLGGNNADNQGIQSAIWDLLDTDGSTHTAGNYTAWLNNAIHWETTSSASTLAAFASQITIYDSISGGNSDCPTPRMQEFIDPSGASAVPEPGTVGLLGFGLGLVALSALRKRRR